MGKIKHSSVGTELTQTEWEAEGTHLIGDAGSLDVVRTATYVVAANDAMTQSKAQSDSICDNTADQTTIKTLFDGM